MIASCRTLHSGAGSSFIGVTGWWGELTRTLATSGRIGPHHRHQIDAAAFFKDNLGNQAGVSII
jgi:hypothetical protein